MGIRKFFGNLFIIFGILNIANFWAPRPIPTVGPSAFIIGLLLIGTGIFLRLERDSSGNIQWDRFLALFQGSKTQNNSSRMREDKQNISDTKLSDPLIAVRVLRLAEQKQGILSISQTAMELNIPLGDAEAGLDECVARGTATIEVDPNTGLAYYRFPEFLPR
ncbi:hypothetical protein [Gracilinema caldarium]|uniref:TM2 domain-containing protein n=1 Tax=Gracilinema caldarium (strain ATCC 51460 / DSM 7334 / H1) TaxID=744872 RepID=F8F202_GRAC1|nr:hypothetical protein [Gracilinema caldarium]AEJ19849.1 TM2 domain-containing protein [Gracilinema caldarium DSM 7334]